METSIRFVWHYHYRLLDIYHGALSQALWSMNMVLSLEDVNAELANINPKHASRITFSEFSDLVKCLRKEELSPHEVGRAFQVSCFRNRPSILLTATKLNISHTKKAFDNGTGLYVSELRRVLTNSGEQAAASSEAVDYILQVTNAFSISTQIMYPILQHLLKLCL